jgi:hypothetical protein
MEISSPDVVATDGVWLMTGYTDHLTEVITNNYDNQTAI